ncbi:hypothetical protein OHA72_09975 [Dactylosporangium sp. NBC_01737]|uniref:hypothetical protein n=1 Tax=Dactylosporangium sp. NBC_01737 TaxID=2975959 RepID=UPI002E154177|nr:hypothetical protein OHA72_09975 [Dactylosporangium sp. NBC_01737]
MTGTAEAFTAAASAASPSLRLDDGRQERMSILGTEALICYRHDDAEHARRRAVGAAGIISSDVLEMLLGLPIGLPVPIRSLTTREAEAVRRAPSGALSLRDGQVTRHAVTPVTVDLAVVAARTWRSGLESAGRFAPFCARAMVLRRRPADLAEVRLQAGFYGVGVVLVDGRSAEVLVEPTPFQRHRFTAAGWRFVEQVYRQSR